MNEKKRGAWGKPISSPETQLRILMARYNLGKEGTVTKEFLEFLQRRRQLTAQPRR